MFDKVRKKKGRQDAHAKPFGKVGILPDAEKIDITELGFNDNLNAPYGVIKQAQEEFARLFGSKNAIFLTNGSSQGIMAFLGVMQEFSVAIYYSIRQINFSFTYFNGLVKTSPYIY